jgi:hypothetical protein
MSAPVRFRVSSAVTLIALTLLLAISAASCRSVFSRKYEYDEDVHLSLDGSATVYVNAAIPALVALRGLDLDVDPRARLDLDAVRAAYETPVSHVASATGSRRDNRRYVHLRIDVSDIRRLAEAPPFGWSRYALDRTEDLVIYRQTVRGAAGRDVGNVGWDGDEIVAFRLHLPSRVPFHNSPAREIERGNIIVWDQKLTDRREGIPIDIEVRMEPESILIRTLMLYGLTILLAGATFALAIWWTVRQGRNTRSS